ncbi:MAG: DUF4271 domain-containing protein [Rikenellaceae bacterium]
MNTALTPEEHIFGIGSRVVELSAQLTEPSNNSFAISSELSFEIAVLIILIFYILWVGRSMKNMNRNSFKVTNPFAEITETRGGVGSYMIGDIVLEWSLIISMGTLFVIRLVEVTQQHYPPIAGLAEEIVSLGIGRWMTLVGLSFVLMMLWGLALVHLMGYLLKCNWMTQSITILKNRILMMSLIWVLPVVLMSTFEVNHFFMSYVAMIVAVVFIGIYLFRTFLLFMTQKISILHWFLYLCGVEVVPLTLLWVIFVR